MLVKILIIPKKYIKFKKILFLLKKLMLIQGLELSKDYKSLKHQQSKIQLKKLCKNMVIILKKFNYLFRFGLNFIQ